MNQKTLDFLEDYRNTLEILQVINKRTESADFTFTLNEGGQRFPSGGGANAGTKALE